jgi:hypothetical protein
MALSRPWFSALRSAVLALSSPISGARPLWRSTFNHCCCFYFSSMHALILAVIHSPIIACFVVSFFSASSFVFFSAVV